MKRLIIFILLLSSTANATCNWATGITSGPNKTFIYTEECHQAVGALVQANKDLTMAIQLKDLAIKFSDDRVILWQKSSSDELDRLTKMEQQQSHNDVLMFGLGLLTAVGTGFALSRLYR